MHNLHPMQLLTDEHRLIERVLGALEMTIRDLDGEHFPRQFFEQALDFFANFADRCHHGKEEDCLFPLLKRKGIPEHSGPIGVMLHEHSLGREHLAAIRANLDAAAGGDTDAVSAIRAEAAGYIRLLRQHMRREDDILFVVARSVLTPDDLETLREQFELVERDHIGKGIHDRYEALADRLSDAVACRR